jgi:Cap4-like dsDNA endonuclease family protein
LGYQKKFIAYLCVELISEKRNIKKISCEWKDDILVEEDSKFVYYQIKSTNNDSLPKNEIMDSLGLFCTITNPAKISEYNEYVLVSNARIANFRDHLKKYSFNQLNKEIKYTIESLECVRNNINILQNIYFLRGPPLIEIASTVVSGLVHALNQGQYNLLKIKDDLLSSIDNMCPGPTDIEDMKIINDNETDDYNLKLSLRNKSNR